MGDKVPQKLKQLLLNEHAFFNASLVKIVKFVYALLQCIKMNVAFIFVAYDCMYSLCYHRRRHVIMFAAVLVSYM